jgi:hypothetical protein
VGVAPAGRLGETDGGGCAAERLSEMDDGGCAAGCLGETGGQKRGNMPCRRLRRKARAAGVGRGAGQLGQAHLWRSQWRNGDRE